MPAAVLVLALALVVLTVRVSGEVMKTATLAESGRERDTGRTTPGARLDPDPDPDPGTALALVAPVDMLVMDALLPPLPLPLPMLLAVMVSVSEKSIGCEKTDKL